MTLLAGTGKAEINPLKPMFLYGYPHVERLSTGVNDPLYASTLLLQNEKTSIALISLDILMISPQVAEHLRQKVAALLATSHEHVFITCTHTHSAPVTCKVLAFELDPVVPEIDPEYMTYIENQILESVSLAKQNLRSSQLAWTSCQVDGVGCNRRNPDDARDPEVGMLCVRDAGTKEIFGLSLTYCMHPTVMHEDSTLASGDFPGYTRLHLQEKLGADLVTVYQTGPEGNQSPRYHVKGQTFAEAERLGRRLGEFVWQQLQTLSDGDYQSDVTLLGAVKKVPLQRRALPTVEEAKANLVACRNTFEELKRNNAGHGPVRTAECSVFGAEETNFLAKCQQDGRLDEFMQDYTEADIQVVRIGDYFYVGWPGEIFVEFDLELKEKADHKAFVSCLVNGDLQGYIVTEEAVKEGGYEATNAMFKPETATLFIDASLELINTMKNNL